MAANFYGGDARAFGNRVYSAEHQKNYGTAFHDFARFKSRRALFQRALSNRILLRVSRLGTARRRASAFVSAHGASRRADVFSDYRQYCRPDKLGRFCRNKLYYGDDAFSGDVSGSLGLRPFEGDFIFKTSGKPAFFQARISLASFIVCRLRFRADLRFRVFPRRKSSSEISARRLNGYARRTCFRLNLRRPSSLYENRRA